MDKTAKTYPDEPKAKAGCCACCTSQVRAQNTTHCPSITSTGVQCIVVAMHWNLLAETPNKRVANVAML